MFTITVTITEEADNVSDGIEKKSNRNKYIQEIQHIFSQTQINAVPFI
jgi:hypothetical protein